MISFLTIHVTRRPFFQSFEWDRMSPSLAQGKYEVELKSGTHLLKIQAVQNKNLTSAYDIFNFYSNKSWSHNKIDHLIKNMINTILLSTV